MPTRAYIPPYSAAVVTLNGIRRFDVQVTLICAPLGLEPKEGETFKIWGIPIEEGRFLLLNSNSEILQLRESFEASMTDEVIDEVDGEGKHATILRKLSGFFEVSCHRRTRASLRFTLPAEVADLNIARAGPLFVFVSGKLVEIWSKDRWNERNTVPDVAVFIDELREALGNRR